MTMRPWDNFFWWLEADGLPAKSMVAPGNWPPQHEVRPSSVIGKRLAINKVTVKTKIKHLDSDMQKSVVKEVIKEIS